VDTKVNMTANSPVSQNAPAGSAVASPPSTIVKTTKGVLVANVKVHFAVTSGGGTVAGDSFANVTTGTSGVATASDWVINANSNTVQAVGTYVDPSVTFGAAPAGSGFPQAVTVDPSVGITFTATGGDVIPYGSTYQYSSGAADFDPDFGVSDFTTTGSAAGPFGTGNLGGTSCPINNDAAFPPNHLWPLSSDLLLLKTFPLPQGWSAPLTVTAAIDNDIRVFVNGHPLTTLNDDPLYHFVSDLSNYSFDPTTLFVTHANCATKGSLTFTVPVAYLVAGQNTIAVRARDRGVVDYVDLKVTAPTPQ
jgi:hypothetical protein